MEKLKTCHVHLEATINIDYLFIFFMSFIAVLSSFGSEAQSLIALKKALLFPQSVFGLESWSRY